MPHIKAAPQLNFGSSRCLVLMIGRNSSAAPRLWIVICASRLRRTSGAASPRALWLSCWISGFGPTRFRRIGPTLHGSPAGAVRTD